MEDRAELYSYELITPEDFSKSRRIPATVGKIAQTPPEEEEAIFMVEDTFVTTPPLRSGGDFQEARGQHAEGQPTGLIVGGIGGRRSNVMEPGRILPVMGPASSHYCGVDLKYGGIPTSPGTRTEAEEQCITTGAATWGSRFPGGDTERSARDFPEDKSRDFPEET